MKELILSALLATYGQCVPYTDASVEQGKKPRNDRESWCSCVLTSDHTDMDLSYCDTKYGTKFNFDYERDCECQDIPFQDEERPNYASPWIDSIWKMNK